MRLIDPLAQSFYVQDENGIFVTSIDIYFFSKDEILPVTLQLRSMELGLPTSVVYPFSEVVLDPSQVNVSSSASIPTRFTFPSPVYLTGDTFHSIVLLSNSEKYNVWVSELGQVDITSTVSGLEANQIVVNKQPLLGGLFKSQNASTWNEQPLDDLKFTLYRANFKSSSGSVSFYNPELSKGNSQIATLLKDSLEMSSRKIKVGIGTTLQEPNLTYGNTIIQNSTGAYANYISESGIANGTLQIINSGIGYTPSSGSLTYNDVLLTSVTGDGINATANITISNGVAVAATVSSGGIGYVVGDVLTASSIGSQGLGRNLRLSVSNLSGVNELILDNVQGNFATGVGNTLYYQNNSGVTTAINSSVGGNVVIPSDGITVLSDGLHIRVNHKNHGMYDTENRVIISNVASDIKPTKLTQAYEANSTSDILIESSSNFTTFENVAVSISNPGYVLINSEIIAYTGTTATSLTGITRGIAQTQLTSHSNGTEVIKYELNGISLRRINTEHSLEDSEVDESIGLDYYTIKIDTSQAGKTSALPQGQVDRTSSGSFIPLYSNTTKSTGGQVVNATQNIQFEIVRPVVQTMTVNQTNITSQIRTISGRSVSGNESSFEDKGVESISLVENNYFNSPRLIASKVNENTLLGNLEGNKSLRLTFGLETSNPKVSPVIDLDRVGLILSSNRVNQPIEDYITDFRTSTLQDDPNAFVYSTKPIELEIPANSIKIIVAAYINQFSDIRAFYSITNDPLIEEVFYPFPGYKNLNNLRQVIDISQSDGSSDLRVSKTDVLSVSGEPQVFRDYEFSIDNLETFRYFSIKLVGTSTNQAYPPRFRDLRVIALAPS